MHARMYLDIQLHDTKYKYMSLKTDDDWLAGTTMQNHAKTRAPCIEFVLTARRDAAAVENHRQPE
jgi:hypothetical protein